jgi:hypothetical protein
MARMRETGILTLAAIRGGKNRPLEYLFHERQRIFTLAAPAAADGEPARLLKAAHRARRPIRVGLDLRRGQIQRISVPSEEELEEFRRGRVALDKPDKTVPIEVGEIDPTTFNFVDLHLKSKSFRHCREIVPSYRKAKEMFDFCAGLSCNLPGPYAVTPCIPFQYVIDGCYARAHQMRRIITTRYRYCCEKVFSFANQGNDTLAVKADKWGGCCVTWWYHVAPLIRVRMRLKGFPKKALVLAMVIDPGMFDKPVLLSSWLAAQENAGCSPDAHVSMYSIQPGSAYWPMDYAGATYGTDPNYALTQATLIAYSGLTTC